MPLHADEQKYFVAKISIKGVYRYLVFLRTAQGPRGAPLTWARYAALIMRLTQSLHDPLQVRLQCFVDDPIAVVRGSELERRTTTALMMLTWEALGCHLSYAKGQYGKSVSWIGGEFEMGKNYLKARVKDSIVCDIRLHLQSFRSSNVIARKDLESFAGKVNHAAGLLVTVRPFLQQLWSALHSELSGPRGCIWRRQIQHTLKWLEALFHCQSEQLIRTFRVDAYMGRGLPIQIGTDASPWGLGGWLAINGRITKFYRSAVSADDIKLFDLTHGSCEGQQILESLAILVAVRLWLPSCLERINFTVRGDNVGALTLVTKMRPKSSQLAIIARELALCFANFSFMPSVYHTPGISHVVADGLSRVGDPNKQYADQILAHPALKDAEETIVPARDRFWYRTL